MANSNISLANYTFMGIDTVFDDIYFKHGKLHQLYEFIGSIVSSIG